MAVELTSNAVQIVASGGNVAYTETAVPCTQGYVIHREGAGVVTLRGIPSCNCQRKIRYKVSFGANIAVPTGQTPQEITIALAINGEAISTSTAAVTPAAAERYFNVFNSMIVEVPRGCCYTISVKNTSAIPIDVRNANIMIER